jgi:hypothetical protein
VGLIRLMGLIANGPNSVRLIGLMGLIDRADMANGPNGVGLIRLLGLIV